MPLWPGCSLSLITQAGALPAESLHSAPGFVTGCMQVTDRFRLLTCKLRKCVAIHTHTQFLRFTSTGDEALFQCTKPSGVPRGPSHLQFPWPFRATMRSPLRSPAQVEGTQGFLPQPGKDLERPSSTRLEARFPYHGLEAMTRSPSPLAWRPDFPGAPREAH